MGTALRCLCFSLPSCFGLVLAIIVGPGVRSVGQVKPLRVRDDITLAARASVHKDTPSKSKFSEEKKSDRGVVENPLSHLDARQNLLRHWTSSGQAGEGSWNLISSVAAAAWTERETQAEI